MERPLVIGLVKNPLQWEHWSEAEAMLDPALALSDETWIDVKRALDADTMQLVAVVREGGDPTAVAIVRTIKTKVGDMIEIFVCGGRHFHEWAIDLANAIEDGARRTGCVGVRTWGRPGWKTIFKPLGWKADVVCFEKVF